MSMTKVALQEAIDEAERFIKRAKTLRDSHPDSQWGTYFALPAEQGAVRRSSMDLTRALSKLRRRD